MPSFVELLLVLQVTPTVAEPLLPQGTLVRWMQLAATALFLGAVTFRLAVIRPLDRSPETAGILAAAAHPLRLLTWSAVGLLVIAAPMRLMEPVRTLLRGNGQAAVGDEAVTGAGSLLFQTAWGAGWWIHLAASALALVGVVLLRGEEDRARGWQIMTGAAVLLPLAPALSGSAWVTDPRVLAVPATYLHVGAMGAWLGGLVALLWVGLPAARRLADAPGGGGMGTLPPLARVVNAFSRVALPAVVVLIFTGVLSNWMRLGSLSALFGTGYGRVLLVKIGVAGAAFLLGFYNWRRVRPSLEERPDAGQLRIPALLEVVLGVVVLLITAILVATPRP
jgi:putative copper export protein